MCDSSIHPEHGLVFGIECRCVRPLPLWPVPSGQSTRILATALGPFLPTAFLDIYDQNPDRRVAFTACCFGAGCDPHTPDSGSLFRRHQLD